MKKRLKGLKRARAKSLKIPKHIHEHLHNPPKPHKIIFFNYKIKFLVKRAQTGMEYILTYGWAVLIILFALSSLFYIGVFEPKTPNTCIINAPFICNDVKAYDDTVIYTISSQGLTNAEVTDLKINGQSCSSISELGDLGLITNPGSNSFNINSQNQVICVGLEQDLYQKASSEIILNYETQQGLQHTITGTSSANIEGPGSEFILDYALLNDPDMSLGFNFENGLEELGNYAGGSITGYGVQFEDEEIINGVLYLNSSNSSYFSIDNQPILNSDVLTIEFLIKSGVDAQFAPVITKYLEAGEQSYFVRSMGPGLQVGVRFYDAIGGPGGTDIGFPIGNEEDWHHVAIVFDGYNLLTYSDGEFQMSDSACTTNPPCRIRPYTIPILIGADEYSFRPSGAYFKGYLDSIAIYDRVLSPEEIREHYEHYTPPAS